MALITERPPKRRRRRHYEGEPKDFFPRLGFHFRRKCRKVIDRTISELTGASAEVGPGLKGGLLLFYCRYLSRVYKVVPIAGYRDKVRSVSSLAETTDYTIAGPQMPGIANRQVVDRFPAIEAHLFEGVSVASCSSAILSDHVFVPDLYIENPNAIICDHRFLLWQSQNGEGIVRHTSPKTHAAGIMLFGSGAYNWYHWLIEILPAAHMARNLPSEFADFPLLIPEELADQPTFRDSLALFSDKREIVLLGAGTHHINRLVTIDAPVREPMNMRLNQWPDVADYAYHPGVLLEYRNAIRERLGTTTDRHDDRIFLARANGRRSYNQDELLAIAEQHGFRAVYPEKLTFREQVETFTGAAFIIGPSGAAFANTLFCQPGTRLLSWLVPQYRGFCSFANIARTVGGELRYLFATADRPINSTFDAFVAEYRIDPVEFEAAVQLALSSPDY